MALAILGGILVITYAVATRLFNLGTGARERTQISDIMQNQAELIRGLRDRGGSWTSFRTATASCQAQGGCKVAVDGAGVATVAAGPLTSGLFTILITSRDATSSEVPSGTPVTDKLIFNLHGTWSDASGVTNKTDIDFFLTNTDQVSL
jgi:hypothetical protein